MLYLFLTGKPLFPIDRDDDHLSGDTMREVMDWSHANLEAKLAIVKVRE